MIKFFSDTFSGIKSAWNDEATGVMVKWAIITITPCVIFIVVAIGGMAYDEIKPVITFEYTVKSGVVIEKRVRPPMTYAIKGVPVTMEAECHIVMRGKNIYGREMDRDITVDPNWFNELKVGSEIAIK